MGFAVAAVLVAVLGAVVLILAVARELQKERQAHNGAIARSGILHTALTTIVETAPGDETYSAAVAETALSDYKTHLEQN